MCFEVEEIESFARWRTVMVHGTYEELWEEVGRDHAIIRIAMQGDLTPLSLVPYTGRPEMMVVYRIRVRETMGRFEHDEAIHDVSNAQMYRAG